MGQDGGSEARVVQRCQRGGKSARAQVRKVRSDGWTEVRRATFLQVLSETCNVYEAARAAGLNKSSAYDLRRRDATFATQWDEALEQAYCELELMLLRQMLHGTERVEVTRGPDGADGAPGKIKATKTIKSYPLAMALRLLSAHKTRVERYRAERARRGVEQPNDPDVVARVKAEMDRVRARLTGHAPGAEAV